MMEKHLPIRTGVSFIVQLLEDMLMRIKQNIMSVEVLVPIMKLENVFLVSIILIRRNVTMFFKDNEYMRYSANYHEIIRKK